MSEVSNAVATRREIVAFVEVRYGNPNGDPDMGNAPRMDPVTGQGYMTDVSVKRVIRNYVADVLSDEPGYRIYISEGAVLERAQQEGYIATGHGSEGKSEEDADEADDESETGEEVAEKAKSTKVAAKPKGNKAKVEADVRRWLCTHFFDVRTFGAVLASKSYSAGSINGPVQISFSRSVDPIVYDEVGVTRCAVTAEKDESKERTIGRKHVIPYALYRVEVRISPYRAMGPKGSGFHEHDMAILEKAILDGFEHRSTASKGGMATRAMFVYEHSSALGEAPAFQLLERITAQKNTDSPRQFSDYDIKVDATPLPEGVTLRRVR